MVTLENIRSASKAMAAMWLFVPSAKSTANRRSIFGFLPRNWTLLLIAAFVTTEVVAHEEQVDLVFPKELIGT